MLLTRHLQPVSSLQELQWLSAGPPTVRLPVALVSRKQQQEAGGQKGRKVRVLVPPASCLRGHRSAVAMCLPQRAQLLSGLT